MTERVAVNLAARIAGIVVIATGMGGVDRALADAVQPSKTNLPAFLTGTRGGLPSAGTTLELDPHWVGTVKQTFVRDPRAVLKPDAPEELRLTHLTVQLDEAGAPRLVIARMRSVPEAFLTSSGRDAPSFALDLPTRETIATATNLGALMLLLGEPDGGSSGGWGGFGTVHWVKEWSRVTLAQTNQLRYLNVLAYLSAPAMAGSAGPKPSRTNAAVDLLLIREGTFRPADPKSAEELKQFPTADELFARAQAERAREREKYPQPLRALIEAKEKPDDPDAEAYVEAINGLRETPDAKVIRQIVAAMNEDEVEFGSYLDDLFGQDSDLEDVAAWKPEPRAAAARAVVDALNEVKTADALTAVLGAVLATQGGGKLKFTVPGTKAVVDLSAEKEGKGFTTTDASDGVTDANAAKAAAQAQAELKKKYAGLWQSSPVHTEPPK